MNLERQYGYSWKIRDVANKIIIQNNRLTCFLCNFNRSMHALLKLLHDCYAGLKKLRLAN